MIFNVSSIIEKLRSPAFSIFIILLFHVSGLIGLQTSSRNWFIDLTPLNLLVSFIVMIRHENYKNTSLYLCGLLIFSAGFFLEVAGVNTGIIFGAYHYGPILGLKIFNTPLLIGLNWFTMVFCVGVLLEKTKGTIWLKSIIGAGIMTLSDFIIEPVAISFHFWTWEKTSVPLQNYLAWYLFSLLFLLIFFRFRIDKTNKVAPWLFVIQIIFFLSLNLLI
ncbi:MAG TPA: carotenoid biosynthesis protein [Cytophagaceae bacterium]|jgi:putative membrane protein|nr:carotenoid biosynthesis protein [Cytophagaceae bacterium]